MANSESIEPFAMNEASEEGTELPQSSPEELNAEASGDSAEHHDRCLLWMNNHRLGWLESLPEKWPRTFSLLFGVIMPLWLLIGVSLFFGYGLAQLEAPAEIDGNNDIIANRALMDATTQFRSNVTERLPRICLEIFSQSSSENMSISDNIEAEFDDMFGKILDRKAQTPFNATTAEFSSQNSSELMNFMMECGKVGLETADKFAFDGMDSALSGDSLSFNWIRCDGLGLNSSTKLYQQIWGRPFVNRSRLQPDAQAAAAVIEWRRNQLELYSAYMEDLILEDGTRPVGARLLAFRQSLEYSNGFDQCYPNSAAGAWFWFTVMTTIGYGNTAPITQGGRAMIYTLGFFSILLFAGVLGTAGTIVVAIWDDFIDRTKLHQFNIPWVGCIFWGFCYYLWMLAIAAYTRHWKAERLGEEPELSEMFWFSYISTTTVGLGDNFLEHDVILRQDLITFPLLFLTGFVLLANFFVKLAELLTNLIPRNSQNLEEKLANSDVPCFPKAARKAVQAPMKIIAGVALSGRSNPTKKVHDESDQMSDSDDGVEVTSAVQVQNQTTDSEPAVAV